MVVKGHYFNGNVERWSPAMVKVALNGTTNWCFWEIGSLALHLDAEEMLEKIYYFIF